MKLLRPAKKNHPAKRCDGKTIRWNTTLHKDEASVAARMNKSYRGSRIFLTENWLQFYNGQTHLEVRDRKHYKGTTRSDAMGPIVLPPWSDVPKMSSAGKLQFWGSRRVAAGGRVPGHENDDEGEKGDEESDDVDEEMGSGSDGEEADMLPLSYHGVPKEVLDDIVHSSWGKCILDLMPGIGVMAKLSIALNMGYLGICHNKCQREWLEKELTKFVLSEMANPSSRLYSHSYGKFLAATADSAGKAEVAKADKADKDEDAEDDDGEGEESEEPADDDEEEADPEEHEENTKKGKKGNAPQKRCQAS